MACGSERDPAGGGAARPLVLVVDDELGPRESLRMLLKPFYEVSAAASVAEAVEALRARPPDLIISDIRMPGRSGIQGLEDIRAEDAEVCVFMLTGYGDLETAREALRKGADDYIRKPFDTREMLELVREGVEKSRRRRAARREQAEIERLAEKLQRDIAEHSHMAALGMASSEMIHDIRNPLTIVMGYADLLHEELAAGPGQEGAIEYIGSIRESLRHCTEIMEGWRALGRRSPHSIQSIPVGPFLEEVLRAAGGPGGGTAPRILLEGDAGALLLSGDRVQLRRALQNIVMNAVQAAPEPGGEVTLACRPAGGELEIEVRDNGPGIPPERIGRVFEAFFTTKDESCGTGLGLFIAKQVIEGHGGTIEIGNRPARGAVVRIRLPREPAGATDG